MSFLEGLLYMLWRGIAIGVIISAPMGPVGILCVQRTLEKGRTTGFFTGVGAALSDLFYCLLTGFGLSLIEDFLKAHQDTIQLIGSIVLVVFGLWLFKSNPSRTLKKPESNRASKGKNVLSGFLFTFSNPLIIFLIIGLFARFNFLSPEISAVQYIVGYLFIIVGALVWWWIVTFFVDKVRTHFNIRSMWLINRIIGGVIMAFALVGIISAFSGSSKAVNHRPIYQNSTRGFGDLGVKSAPLRIASENQDTTMLYWPLLSGQDFSFSFRAVNINNALAKSYPYLDLEGKKRLVQHPAWGIILKNSKSNNLCKIRFATRSDAYDGLSQEGFDIGWICNNQRGSEFVNRGFDFFDGENSFMINRQSDGRIFLRGGNRKYNPLLELDAIGFEADSIGFFVEPGGLLSIDYLKIESSSSDIANTGTYDWGNESVRKAYFARSLDRIEGEWEVFDRMLDDETLRAGGNYRLAAVVSSDGYDFYYLSGALKNPDSWNPGKLKIRLIKTAFNGVFDVEWYDPAGVALQGEIKAQVESDIIAFQFADYGGSTLRLRKVKAYGE